MWALWEKIFPDPTVGTWIVGHMIYQRRMRLGGAVEEVSSIMTSGKVLPTAPPSYYDSASSYTSKADDLTHRTRLVVLLKDRSICWKSHMTKDESPIECDAWDININVQTQTITLSHGNQQVYGLLLWQQHGADSPCHDFTTGGHWRCRHDKTTWL